jgi:hypothetical protein
LARAKRAVSYEAIGDARDKNSRLRRSIQIPTAFQVESSSIEDAPRDPDFDK